MLEKQLFKAMKINHFKCAKSNVKDVKIWIQQMLARSCQRDKQHNGCTVNSRLG